MTQDQRTWVFSVLQELERKRDDLELLATVSAHERGVILYYLKQRWIPKLQKVLDSDTIVQS